MPKGDLDIEGRLVCPCRSQLFQVRVRPPDSLNDFSMSVICDGCGKEYTRENIATAADKRRGL